MRVSQLPRWLVVLGLAGAYLATARLGLSLALPPDYKATAVWPPSGIALGVVFLARRAWPGVWLGAFAANLWDAFDPARGGTFAAHLGASAAIATGSTLQALAGAALVRRYVGPEGVLARAPDAFRFAALVPAACLTAATAGAGALVATGLVPWDAAPDVWWTWWVGDTVGALVLAPVVLCAARCERLRPPVEAVALFALLLGCCALVFGGWGPRDARSAPLAYLSLPLLVWSAVRFGPRGATLAVVVIATAAVWGTVRGAGPFAHPDVYRALILLDVFLAVVAVTSLVLGAVLREREAAEVALRASEARARQMAEALPQILWATAPDGTMTYLNGRWTEYTGRSGLSAADTAGPVHPDDAPRMKAAWVAAQKDGRPFEYEFRLRAGGAGTYRWFLARAVPLTAPDGRPGGWLGTSTDIDDLKRAQAELAQQKAELQLILDTVPALIFYKDRQHRLVRVNNELVRLVGLPREAILGRTDSELGSPHADDYRRHEEAIMRGERTPRTVVEPLYTLTGTRWLQTTKLPYRDPAGRVVGVLGLSVDVTDQKQAEAEVRRLNAELEGRVAERTAEAEARAAELQRAVEALREQKQLLQTILDSLGEAVMVADRGGRTLLYNKAFRELHPGASEAVAIGELSRAYGVYLPDGRALCPPDRLPIARVIRGESCDDVHLLVVDAAHPGGVPISVTGRPILGPGGVEGGVIAIRDITAIRRAAEELAESEGRFRGAFDHAPIGIALVSPAGRWLKVNQALCRMLGYAEAELLATDFQTITHPDDLGTDLDLVGAVLRGERASYQMEKRYLHKDGHLIFALLAVSLVRGAVGEPLYFVSQVKDITERKRAEHELRESRTQLGLALEAAQAGVWSLDLSARAFVASEPARALHGVAPGEPLDHDGALLRVHPDDRPRVGAALERTLSAGDRYQVEYRVAGADRWLAAFAEVQPGPSGPHLVGLVQDVTERKRAEEALRESEARFRAFMDHMPAAGWVLDADSRVVFVNRFYGHIVGVGPDGLVGKTAFDLYPPHIAEQHQANDRRALADGRFEAVEQYVRPDGTPGELLVVKFAYRDASGRSLIGGVAVDVTERNRAEAALRESEERYRETIEAAPDAIVTTDAAGTVLGWNRGAERVFGWAAAEAVGRTVDLIVPPEHLGACRAAMAAFEPDRARLRGRPREVTAQAKGGAAVPVEIALAHWGHGPARRFTAIIRDATERKRAEHALRVSEERFRVLFEQSSDAHLIFDEADGILDCNRAAVDMLRHPNKGAVLALHPAVLSPEFQPDGRRSLEKCVEMDAAARRHGHHRFDWLHRRADGEVFPCEVTLTPVVLGGRTVLLAVWHDLTERHRAEAALRASEERYRTVVQALAEGVVVQDRDGVIVTCNDRAPEILGLTRDQLTGRTSLDPRWHAVRDDGSPFPGDEHPAMVVLRNGVPQSNVLMGVHTPAGELRWISINAAPVPGADPAGAAVVCSFHDVTAVREANDRLRASVHEKEAMLKEIHHRVKNNLQIISTLLELQSDGLTDPAAVAAFRESRGRVRSMSLIHERLYRSENLASVEFGAYLRGLAEDLFRAYRADDEAIRLTVAVDAPPLPLDLAIPCGLLVNELVSNCLKYAFAGREGGSIAISLARAGAGPFVLAVADDGVGLPPGLDPRTAASFGLQLVSTLAAQLRGELDLGAGPGARVTVRFPGRD